MPKCDCVSGAERCARFAKRRPAHHRGLQPQVKDAGEREHAECAQSRAAQRSETAGILPPEHCTAHKRPCRKREQHVLRGCDRDLGDDGRIHRFHGYLTVKV